MQRKAWVVFGNTCSEGCSCTHASDPELSLGAICIQNQIMSVRTVFETIPEDMNMAPNNCYHLDVNISVARRQADSLLLAKAGKG